MKTGLTLRRQSTVGLVALMGGLAIAACTPAGIQSSSSAGDAMGNRAAPTQDSLPATAPALEAVSPPDAQKQAMPSAAMVVPQLVKTASLSITVDSVERSLERVSAIARQNQGEIVNLQDQAPGAQSPEGVGTYSSGDRHTAVVQLRVPQTRLEASLAELRKLGAVQQQSITAEDVSTQLVDFQARLKNLRNTEAMLLKIMNRSGDMADVLRVAQEVSNVRNLIEQIDAQVNDLKNRVAYSTISVNLQEAIATVSPERSLETQMQETWEQATNSVGKFTVALMKLGLWLLVYSPYWLALMIAAVAIKRQLRQGAIATATAAPDFPAGAGGVEEESSHQGTTPP